MGILSSLIILIFLLIPSISNSVEVKYNRIGNIHMLQIGDTIHAYSPKAKSQSNTELHKSENNIINTNEQRDYTFDELSNMSTEQLEEIGHYSFASSRYLEIGDIDGVIRTARLDAERLEKEGSYSWAAWRYRRAGLIEDAKRVLLRWEEKAELQDLELIANEWLELGDIENGKRVMNKIQEMK